MKRNGPSTEPWGTPYCTCDWYDTSSFTATNWWRSDKYKLTQAKVWINHGLDDLTNLYNSSFPIEENEWNCSSGDLQCIWWDIVADSCMVTILSLIVLILEVKLFIKSLLLCCWEMSATVDVIFLVNLSTVLNKYLGLCLFSSKRGFSVGESTFLLCNTKYL